MFVQTPVRRAVSGSGDDLLLLADSTVDQPVFRQMAGSVQAVYLDPPFMTGDVYDRRRRFGTQGWRTGSPSPVYPGYDDRHPSRDAYLSMLRGLLTNARLLLKDDGLLMLHLDWHAGHLGRLLCE